MGYGADLERQCRSPPAHGDALRRASPIHELPHPRLARTSESACAVLANTFLRRLTPTRFLTPPAIECEGSRSETSLPTDPGLWESPSSESRDGWKAAAHDIHHDNP